MGIDKTAFEGMLALRKRGDLTEAEADAVETVLNLIDRVQREALGAEASRGR